MRRAETLVLTCILLIALAGIGYTFAHPPAKPEPAPREPALTLPAAELLAGRRDFFGTATAPYTLIEFGDYECPPCRGLRPRVKELLAKHKDRLKLDFRNLPLPQIHTQAMYAAIVAEAARGNSSFWPVHNRLYETALSDRTIEQVIQANLKVKALSDHRMQTARHIVEADMALASKLGLQGTPSFLLAVPDGKLYQLSSVESVENFLN